MATATKPQNPFAEPAAETAERVLDFNEKVVDVGKKLSAAYLDAVEKAAAGYADFEEKVAGATRVDWIASAASARAGLTRELTSAYTSAARELIK